MTPDPRTRKVPAATPGIEEIEEELQAAFQAPPEQGAEEQPADAEESDASEHKAGGRAEEEAGRSPT